MGDQIEKKPPEATPAAPKKTENEAAKSFWTTLPGILAQLAVLIGAIAGLIVALDEVGIIVIRPTPTFTPTLTPTPTQTGTSTPTPTQTPPPTMTSSPTPTFTPVVVSTATPSPTRTPTPQPPTPVPVPRLELCVRLLGDSVTVREGPDTSTSVRGRLPADTCLIFDQRLPDNSWVRIAQEQRDSSYVTFALGWVKSELLSESDEIAHLFPYIPEDAHLGYYCINTGSGLNVRDCADTGCRQTATLSWHECLLFDARLSDSAWLRIAATQDNEPYTSLAGNWVSTENFSLVVREFQIFVGLHDMHPYFDLLPVVTPPPTPQGIISEGE